MINDAICAIATPYGVGALSIIRCSGSNTIELVNKIFKGPNLEKKAGNTISYGYIVDNNEIIDEVMISLFRSPKSFTKEDSIEITCHGGVYVTNRVLETLLNNGFRLANRGEFSMRAFLNKRIDLTTAEAIMDVISSNSEYSLKISNNALKSNTKILVDSLSEKILDIIANIEVNIDYPEYEDIEVLTTDIILPRCENLIEEIDEILKNSQISNVIVHGIKTAIIGRPNVGKSSILNDLLGENKAIVTDIAGTTRDLVEGSLSLGPVTLNLIDTAGIHESIDSVEKIGISRSYEALDKAELVLLVLDGSTNLTEIDQKLLDLTASKKRIIIANKTDLGNKIDLNEKYINLSALNKTGLEELINAILEITKINEFNIDSNNYLSNTRQISLMKHVKQSLIDAINSGKSNMPPDIIEIDLKEAWNYLGEITGSSGTDSLINELFSKFCLGK